MFTASVDGVMCARSLMIQTECSDTYSTLPRWRYGYGLVAFYKCGLCVVSQAEMYGWNKNCICDVVHHLFS